ncbi:MAG: multidrug effflux MFS transporter [Pseudomonadota bacterium]
MTTASPRTLAQPAFPEFITAMALTMSLVALAIDTMLPAHGLIGEAFAVADVNDTQYMVYMLFLGLAFGQLLFGPLADCIGRKRAIYIGLGLFAAGTLVSLAAETYAVMLAGRLIQGVGVAGPRVIAVAVVRDLFAGRQMARVMSFVITLFILVPAVAPALGQLIINLSGWRSIFWVYFALAAVILAWFALRQPETLRPENRQPLTPAVIGGNFMAVVRTRVALGYLVAAGLISGAFVGFLGTAQQILQQLYGLGDKFPAFFALLALSVGTSTLINGRIVVKIGMRPLAKAAAFGITAVAAVLLVAALTSNGQPALPVLMACLMGMFLCIGFLFGNLNALAMEPLGHIAGTAAAVIGALTTLISAVLGAFAGALYDDTVIPLAGSFVVLGLATAATILVTDTGEPAAAAA